MSVACVCRLPEKENAPSSPFSGNRGGAGPVRSVFPEKTALAENRNGFAFACLAKRTEPFYTDSNINAGKRKNIFSLLLLFSGFAARERQNAIDRKGYPFAATVAGRDVRRPARLSCVCATALPATPRPAGGGRCRKGPRRIQRKSGWTQGKRRLIRIQAGSLRSGGIPIRRGKRPCRACRGRKTNCFPVRGTGRFGRPAFKAGTLPDMDRVFGLDRFRRRSGSGQGDMR
ncbi:hypothetical protein OFAG_02182 [Oxalobacter formigenes HOxBLS]|uniref:Uncharacterized protein n=1 Tax=Oxalobacter paraformigenes TaxID=556268 RepID=T5LEG7_9BURK|nr:hypothetical protein OFAG_02182 [Oxalobacter paraformigenes]